MLITYLDQLKAHCQRNGVFLHMAWKESRVHTSTHSRTTRRKTDLRLKTAREIWSAVDRIAAKRQQANRKKVPDKVVHIRPKKR